MALFRKCALLPRGPLCPPWSKVFAVGCLATAIIATAACRIDMHVQPRQNPLSRSDFFADQRSARPLVEGTVARGQLHEDTYFYTGKIGNNPGDVMPFPVTKEVLERGPRALQHLLRALPLARGRWQRLRSLARILPASRRRSTSCACRKRPSDTSST